MNRKYILRHIFIAFSLICLTAGAAFTQTTEFTYQGKLTDSGTPQTTYLMQFKLFDAISNGAHIGFRRGGV